MKKFLALTMACVLLISLVSLVACNRKKDDEESGVLNYAEKNVYDIVEKNKEDGTSKVLGTIEYEIYGTDYAIITSYTPRVSGLHSVRLPEEVGPNKEYTVIGIGSEAFRACASVTRIGLPETIETIGDWAFALCSALYEEMVIPASVKSIGKGAFAGCADLAYLTFEDGSKLETIGEYAFNDCELLQDIDIPEGVTAIGNATFQGCTSLNTVVIPNSVKSIGKTAFAECDSITKITLGDNIESIGEYGLGTLPANKPEVLEYKEGSTTDKTLNPASDAE